MAQYLFNPFPCSQSILLGFAKQTQQQILYVFAKVRRHHQRTVQCSFVDLFRVSVVEGRKTSKEFKQESTKAIEISAKRMAFLGYNLRRHILRASTEGIGTVAGILKARLDQSEVRDTGMTILVQQYILRLQVAIGNAHPMQLLKSQQDLSNKEPGHGLIHPLDFLQGSEQLSSRIVIHDKDEEVVGLEGPVQFGKEGVLGCHHYVLFVYDQSLLLILVDEGFAYDLQGVEFAVSFEAGQEDRGEAAAADGPEHLEVAEGGLGALLSLVKRESYPGIEELIEWNGGNGQQIIPRQLLICGLQRFMLAGQSFAPEDLPHFSVEILHSVSVDSDRNFLFWQAQNNIELAFLSFGLVGPAKVPAELALLGLQSVAGPFLLPLGVEGAEGGGVLAEEGVVGAVCVGGEVAEGRLQEQLGLAEGQNEFVLLPG